MNMNMQVIMEIGVAGEEEDTKCCRMPRRPLALGAGSNLGQSRPRLDAGDARLSSTLPRILHDWQHGMDADAKMRHQLTAVLHPPDQIKQLQVYLPSIILHRACQQLPRGESTARSAAAYQPSAAISISISGLSPAKLRMILLLAHTSICFCLAMHMSASSQ